MHGPLTHVGTAYVNWFTGVYWVFMPLVRWLGSLGQCLCGCVQLVRAEVLEDASSSHSGAVGSQRERPYTVKQGVKADNCQGNKFLPGLMVWDPALW